LGLTGKAIINLQEAPFLFLTQEDGEVHEINDSRRTRKFVFGL
jgi:hypothetical protein